MRAAVTNVQVGGDIGMGHAGVSRIRSGERQPSITAMCRIEAAYGWTLDDQVKARGPEYAAAFEAVLARRYGVAEEVPA